MKFIADEPRAKPEQKPTPFYQLPISGDWITLADIKRISVSPSAEFGGKLYPAQVNIVVVAASSGFGFTPSVGEAVYSLKCESDEKAREIRDQIAADRMRVRL
jgi:hypothetical protein